MSYARFTAMIVLSIPVMFGLMYLNTYVSDHIEFSQTRLWMAVMMAAAMAMLMMGMMWKMYPRRGLNVAIVAVSAAVFAGALFMVRSQATVDDVSYMRAMIPHHSIAIMTSERAHIKDPAVRKLADRIIDAQIREIAEMQQHIARLEAHPVSNDANDLPSYRDAAAAPPPPETDSSAGVDTRTPLKGE